MANLSNELVQYRGLFLFILVLGIGGTFQYGFNISVMNAHSPFMKAFINQTWIRRYATPIPPETLTLIWSFVVSVFSIGGLIGSTASGYFIGKFGKKKCLLYNCLLPLASALLVGLSRTVNSIEMIMVGRFLCGFYSGLGINVHAQFAGDIAPRKLRGFINATGPLFVTLGKLFGQIVGLRELLGAEEMWPYLMSASAIPALIQLATLPFFPESPRYLLIDKSDKDGCLKAMKKYWGNHNYQAEIDNMLSEKEICRTTKTMNVLELVRDRSMRWQLYVVICISLALQLSGINAIYYYANSVFVTAGLPVEQIPYMSLGMGSCEVLSSMLCTILIERCGRKTLLLGSYGLMGVMLALLTVTLSLQGWYSWIPYCSAVLIFLYTLFFGVGPGAVTLSVVIEMCSHSSRPAVFVIISSLNWIGMYVIGVAFPYVVASLNQFCFLIFLTCILVSGIFLFVFLPETKGKSLQQITEEFNRFNFREKNSKDTAEISEKIETSV
ncbi:solute carrier family 2, facilitated glucose transporter member 9-like [Spea bombifrons]|uniref:solute carrier family 2, facilitated glucose transporter member 9-like n=1 Tax=Spea bombifrons TaxID=233779 RepID=UPI00234B83A5|nr:solute carrier family 2, facilitated glucose transporter member 9-like [Spea bombifrons]